MKDTIINTLKFLSISLLISVLVACGSGGGGSTPTPPEVLAGTTKILTDSPINGVTYACGGGVRITSDGGKFTCQNAPVTFSIGDLVLGTITTFPADNKIFPQDLAGTTRDDLTGKALRIARLLQSLDNDGTITNTIDIDENAADRFTGNLNSNTNTDTDANLQALFDLFGGSRGLIAEDEAISNLRGNMYSIIINLANASATAAIDTDIVLNFSGASIINNSGSLTNQIILESDQTKTVTVFLINDPNDNQALNITTRAIGFLDSGAQAILSSNRKIYTVNLNLVSAERGMVALELWLRIWMLATKLIQQA